MDDPRLVIIRRRVQARVLDASSATLLFRHHHLPCPGQAMSCVHPSQDPLQLRPTSIATVSVSKTHNASFLSSSSCFNRVPLSDLR